MPEMGGFEAARSLRRRHGRRASARIIGVSAEREERESYEAAGHGRFPAQAGPAGRPRSTSWKVFLRPPEASARDRAVAMTSPFDGLGRLFSTDGFVPRRVCGLWPDWLVWEHVAGNALVWLAYVALPVMIWRLGVRRAGVGPVPGGRAAPSRCSSACAGWATSSTCSPSSTRCTGSRATSWSPPGWSRAGRPGRFAGPGRRSWR